MNTKNPKNAGRKTIDSEVLTETISIRLTKQELEEFQRIADNVGMAKTRLMRNTLMIGLDDIKTLNKIGILKGAVKFVDFKERFLNSDKYQTLSTE